jgi:hypothetical protein
MWIAAWCPLMKTWRRNIPTADLCGLALCSAERREEPLLGGENRRQVSVREGNTQRTIDCRCMQCTKRVMVSTRMTVTRDCTFFQRRQRSKCTGGEVRARRGGKLVSDRRFSQPAGAHQNSRPLRRTPFKAACSPTQVPSIQDTPSHIHNGFKTRYPRSAPNCPPIGCCSCPEAHLCLCSSCRCYSCSQGRCHLPLPAEAWCQDH